MKEEEKKQEAKLTQFGNLFVWLFGIMYLGEVISQLTFQVGYITNIFAMEEQLYQTVQMAILVLLGFWAHKQTKSSFSQFVLTLFGVSVFYFMLYLVFTILAYNPNVFAGEIDWTYVDWADITSKSLISTSPILIGFIAKEIYDLLFSNILSKIFGKMKIAEWVKDYFSWVKGKIAEFAKKVKEKKAELDQMDKAAKEKKGTVKKATKKESTTKAKKDGGKKTTRRSRKTR